MSVILKVIRVREVSFNPKRQTKPPSFDKLSCFKGTLGRPSQFPIRAIFIITSTKGTFFFDPAGQCMAKDQYIGQLNEAFATSLPSRIAAFFAEPIQVL